MRLILAFALFGLPLTGNPQSVSRPLDDNTSASSTLTAAIDTGPCEKFAAGDSKMAPLSAVCQFALTYLRQLPDFVCQQTTTRRVPVNESFSITDKSLSITVMKAQVTYAKGCEHYSKITVDGKPYPDDYVANTNPMGFVSAGELGSDLVDLFRPSVAELRFQKKARFRAIPSMVFEFKVAANKNTF